MKISHEDERASLTWDDEDKSLVVVVRDAIFQKRIIYSDVPQESFFGLIHELEDEEVEGLQTVLDRWEH